MPDERKTREIKGGQSDLRQWSFQYWGRWRGRGGRCTDCRWRHAAEFVARSENARRAQQVASAASEASRIRREADRPKDVTNAASASILKRPRVLTLRQKNLLTIASLWPEFLHIVQQLCNGLPKVEVFTFGFGCRSFIVKDVTIAASASAQYWRDHCV